MLFSGQTYDQPTSHGGPSVALVLAAVGFFTGMACPLAAQDDASLEVTATIANSFFYGGVSSGPEIEEGTEGSTTIEDGFGAGLRVGWRLSERLTGEVGVVTFPTEIEARAEGVSVGFDTDVTMTEGAIRFRLGGPRARIAPYVIAAGGAVSYSGSFTTEWDPMWSIGGGARLELGSVVDLRFALRDYMSSFDAVPDDQDSRFQNHIVLSTGLVFNVF